MSSGRLFLHKNKIFTINTCVYHIYNIYLYCCKIVTMVTRQSEFILFIMLHLVLFDGTTAFVGSDVDNTSETEVLFKSYDFDEACDFCDNEMSRI